MYVPEHFAMSDAEARAMLSQALVGDLVTDGSDGLDVTFVPFVFDEPHMRILTHLTRINPQCRDEGEAMLVVHGHHHVVSATWLPEGSVGTLNYETIVVHGRLVSHDDESFLRDVVARTAERTEQSWHLDQVDEQAISTMLRAAVGVEILIDRIVGKAKLSQNKSPEVLQGIIDGLRQSGHGEDAALLLEKSMPHALAREELLRGLRVRHVASTADEDTR